MVLDEALRYAGRGWAVLPLVGKFPLCEHGSKDATTDEGIIRGWFARWPSANVGIATGSASGIYVIDEDAGGYATIASLGLPPTLTVKTGSGGRHFYFELPAGVVLGNTSKKLGPGVDSRGEGGYVVAPPSLHPDTGKPYTWIATGAELAELPASIVALLTKAKTAPTAPTTPASKAVVMFGGGVGDGWRSDAEERARRYLDRIDGAVSGNGGHNQTMRAASALVNGFALPVEAARGLLYDWNRRCSPPWSEKELEHKLTDAAKDGTFHGLAFGCLREKPLTHNSPSSGGLKELVKSLNAEDSVQDDGFLSLPSTAEMGEIKTPSEIFEPYGLIARIAGWTAKTAQRPCREANVASAIATVSALLGRSWMDRSGLFGALYVFALAPTGYGKEAGRQCTDRLLNKAGLENRIGSGDFTGDAAITKQLKEFPVKIFNTDEVGKTLAKLNAKNAGSHQGDVIPTLMKIFGLAHQGSVFRGKAYAEKDTVVIDEPYAVISATSTPGQFWRGLAGADVEDGFINRLVIIEANGDRPMEQEVSNVDREPPLDIVESAKRIAAGYVWPGVGNVPDVSPTLVECTSDAATFLKKVGHLCDERMKKFPKEDAYWVRAKEQVKRLSMVAALGAWSEQPGNDVPMIEHRDVQWAWAIVSWSILNTISKIHENVAESEEGRLAKQIVVFVYEGGAEGRTKSQITRRFSGAGNMVRRNALETAVESGELVAVKTRADGDKEKTTYWHKAFDMAAQVC